MCLRSAECHVKRSQSMGDDLNAPISILRGRSYRTDGSVSFHPSTYLRSSARRSTRLHAVWGLSIKPALKRSIRCCRCWELETRPRKKRLTCKKLGVSGCELRCQLDDTSFIFRMSAGGREDSMCSKISRGRSDTEVGRIASSTPSGAG